MCIRRFSGKLNGEIAPTTPTGSLIVKASLFWLPGGKDCESNGIVCPVIRLASSAAKVRTRTALAVSTAASVTGFPTFFAMVSTIS